MSVDLALAEDSRAGSAMQQFGFHDVKLCKDEPLGSGSYGAVYKAKCDQLLCAAKVVHSTLFQRDSNGKNTVLAKFEQECQLLNAVKHPNIVQYLGTWHEPDTKHLVLLMELCEQSLTKYLEASPPLPYHVQVNISRDISLALVYLHSNGLIHRDLSSNNVLLVSGTRAKVTDFGMSKFMQVNPRITPLTLCPGTIAYMPPEALEEPPHYSTKLDCFSWGVLAIQIITRKFPDPGPRFKTVSDPRYSMSIRLPVPDDARRKSHLGLIQSSNSLFPLICKCLSYEEADRPSAVQICQNVGEITETVPYAESLQSCRTISLSARPKKDHGEREQSIDELENELEIKTLQIEQLQDEVLRKTKELNELQSQLHQVDNTQLACGEIEKKDAMIQDLKGIVLTLKAEKTLQIKELQDEVSRKTKELSEMQFQIEQKGDTQQLHEELERKGAKIQDLHSVIATLKAEKALQVRELRDDVLRKTSELSEMRSQLQQIGTAQSLREELEKRDAKIQNLQSIVCTLKAKKALQVKELQDEVLRKTKEAELLQSEFQQLGTAQSIREELQKKDTMIQNLKSTVSTLREEGALQVRELQCEVSKKTKQLNEIQSQLQERKSTAQNFSEELERKDYMIQDLKSTVSNLKAQLSAQSPRVHEAAPTPVVEKMVWKEKGKTPHEMFRGGAVVLGDLIYCHNSNETHVHTYNSTSGEWSTLPQCSYAFFALTIVDDILTTVGGYEVTTTGDLFSLSEMKGSRKSQWVKIFPPMPTPRCNAVVAKTNHSLVVAGAMRQEVMTTSVMWK